MEKSNQNNTNKRQFKRLYKKIQSLLNQYISKCIFLSMSFNDETLQRTNEQTRERYIKDYLRNQTAIYIANKDYGKNTEREHYHAFIIATTLKDKDLSKKEYRIIKNKVNLKAYKYGNIRAEIIGLQYRPKNDKDFCKTALYITNHFFKDSTNQSRIITSRKEPSTKEQNKRLKKFYQSLNLNETFKPF